MDLKRVLPLTLVLLLAAGLAAAQETGSIDGRVTGADGTALGGVSVRIDDLGLVTVTDTEGNYSFTGVPAGTYTLTFELVDRTATEEGVTVGAGGGAQVDKTVDWDVSFAETITVTSASRRAERITEAPAAITIVTEQEIEREAAHGQLPKLLEFTPGAEVTQSGVYDFNFNTRGLNSSLNRRVVTLIDGRDPSVPFLGAQEWAAISFPLDDLASAELIRGPSSALYGANAYNGVLNLTTKQPRYSQGGEVRLTGGELQTTNADFRWATGLGGDFYLKLLGGYRASEDYTVSRNVAPEYAVFCTRSGQEDCLPRERIPLVIQDDNEIKFGGIRLDKYLAGGSVFTLEGGTADLQGPVFQTGIGRVQLTDVNRPWGRFNFTSAHFNLLGTYNRRDANDQRSLASGAPLYLDDENWAVEAQGTTEFLGGRGRAVGGLTYGEETIDSANPQGRQTLVFRPIEADMSAAYAQVDFDLTDAIKLVLAGRYDESSLHDSQFSPKASLVWGLNPNHTLRFTYNEAFQVANYSEFFLQAQTTLPGTTTAALNLTPIENALRAAIPGLPPLGFGNIPVMALGNEDLEVEEIRSWEVGYSAILGRRAFLTLDYYNSKLENFITDLLPNLGTLGRLNTNFGAYAPPSSLPGPVQQAILNALRANLPATLFPFLSNNLDGAPIVALASYTNFGEVNTQGIDLAINTSLSDSWSLDVNYSWFDFEVKRDIPGDPLQPNAPENQFKAGLTYFGESFDAAAKMRWVDSFEWFVGPFRGTVPSYEVVDLSGNYHINENLSVGATIANLLDDEHVEAWGGDLLERRALGHVSFRW
ncbi:MAG TPA: TonB-dependent receptor [Thermoanaerobaculia bacterium]|nr:TonB-dependent receptor [Thermoanaerobaculia bacterium]